MLKNMDPPLGFGSKCPDRLAYKKLIRMNMPLDNEGKVHFTTTLFALIRYAQFTFVIFDTVDTHKFNHLATNSTTFAAFSRPLCCM